MKQWYEELFNNYSKSYDNESFTKGTLTECDFIENEIKHNKSIKILDVGCGTGRHSIELAKRGYTVTGIDLSDDQLNRAREKAKQENVDITFLKRDARDFKFENEFDLIIMICEGAFSLMETDEMNFQILVNISNSLKPGGKLIFTCLNALFPLFNNIKDFLNEEGQIVKESSFDLMTFREHQTFSSPDDQGNLRTLVSNERFYAPSEITWLLKSLNFTNIEILGCDIGDWSRDKILSTKNFEMLVVADK